MSAVTTSEPAGATPRQSADGPVYFLVHVPKCAGTTVESYVTGQFPNETLYLPKRRAPARYLGRNYVLPKETDFDRIEFVIGHNFSRSMKRYFAGRPIREAVLLRDPVDHMFSHYNARLRRYERHDWVLYDFRHFYRSRVANPISHFLLNRYLEIPLARLAVMSDATKLGILKDLLQGFWHVGAHSEVAELIRRIAAAKGTSAEFEPRNVNPKRYADRDAFMAEYAARIRAEHALDQTLFEQFCTVNEVDLGPAIRPGLRGGLDNLGRELKRPVLSARSRIKRNFGI